MAMRGERPGERASASRRGDASVASVRLERAVRAAAAASIDEGEFVRRLHQSGVIVRPRFAADRGDVVAGYSVALRPVTATEQIVWYGGGRLARDLTLPRLRDGWPDTPESAQAGVEEWKATSRNPLRYRPAMPGREHQQPGPELWHEYTESVRELRDQLSAVDPTDRVAWARVARETSGAFAAWSQRLEPNPGPLAEASRTLARTAQIRAREERPRSSAGLRSIAGVASLLAMASTGGHGTQAEALLFRQLMRAAQAIHGMHQAVEEARHAAAIRSSLGERLDAVRVRLPEMPDTRAGVGAPEAVQRANAGEGRPLGSPLPTPLAGRATTSEAVPEQGIDR
jgi:hypothetical protein